MEHVDPEVLALDSLGETADDATRAHLAACAECPAEVASLARAVAVGRATTAADTLTPAPDAVWAGIRGELGLSETLEPDGGRPAVQSKRSDPRAVEGATPIGQARSRRGRTPWIAAAAAAGVVVGGAGGAWWAGGAADDEQAVLAEAQLDPLPGWDATGAAVVEENADGSRVLVLTLDGDQPEGGYREVWLIDRDVTRLVSLGVLDGSSGRFTVPEGLDLSDFAVVDVSEESLDGDPSHSGDSIIRGILGA